MEMSTCRMERDGLYFGEVVEKHTQPSTHLQDGAVGCPLLAGRAAGPRAEQRQADLAAVVQVGVEAHGAPPCGLQVDQGGLGRVCGRAEDVKQEHPSAVRGVEGPGGGEEAPGRRMGETSQSRDYS
jgi:hypothetical protein